MSGPDPDQPEETMRYGDGTRVVTAGQPAPAAGQGFLPGPVFAAPYHLVPAADGEARPYYARNDNATWTAFEAALAELEGGPSVAFPSGMAAITALLQAVLRRGDRVVIPSDGYYQVRTLLAEDLVGYDVRRVPTTAVASLAAGGGLDGVRLLLVETPSNPGLDLCDLAVVVPAARAAGCLVAVDNTMATPLGQRPLGFGADFSVASDTKALAGHSDLLLGHVACLDPVWADRLHDRRTRSGAIPGPFEVWLAHRSLGTLDLRLQRQAANALALAELLHGHPAAHAVRYPWRPGDPMYDRALRQLRRPLGVLCFELADDAAVAALLAKTRILLAATSFGGLHTTLDRRAQWGDDVPAGFLRLSCGVEDTVDLVADLRLALDSLGAPDGAGAVDSPGSPASLGLPG